MKTTSAIVAIALAALAGVWVVPTAQARTPAPAAVASLEARIKALEARVGIQEDIAAIYNLQNAYGYYLDKKLYDDVAALFTSDAEIEIGGRGVYRGNNAAQRIFKQVIGGGKNGLSPGELSNHMQLQGVVHVAPDGRTAQGRWRVFGQIGAVGRMALWSEGPYEIEYRKVDGKWMFSKMVWYPTFYTPFNTGWDKTPESPGAGASTQQNQEYPPDAPPSRPITPFPGIYTLPFHYANPVTDRPFEGK